jgi:hypothetical protein
MILVVFTDSLRTNSEAREVAGQQSPGGLQAPILSHTSGQIRRSRSARRCRSVGTYRLPSSIGGACHLCTGVRGETSRGWSLYCLHAGLAEVAGLHRCASLWEARGVQNRMVGLTDDGIAAFCCVEALGCCVVDDDPAASGAAAKASDISGVLVVRFPRAHWKHGSVLFIASFQSSQRLSQLPALETGNMTLCPCARCAAPHARRSSFISWFGQGQQPLLAPQEQLPGQEADHKKAMRRTESKESTRSAGLTSRPKICRGFMLPPLAENYSPGAKGGLMHERRRCFLKLLMQ